MEIIKEKLRYFLYVRKSSESEDRQMASIDDQISEMRKLAEALGINIVDVITESKSAKQPGRPNFNLMMQRIQNGEADAILSWKLNRLARNPVDGGQISWMLQNNIIKHIQTYSSEFKPTDNVMMMQVEFGMANQYVKDLSSDTRRGLRKKAERGWYPASHLPIGYKTNPLEKQIEPGDEILNDSEMFDLMKSLWRKMLTGKYTIASIKREGDKIGIKNKVGKKFSYNAYKGCFTNEFYCGYYYWNDEQGIKQRHQGKHDTMVSEEEFNVVQMYLGKQGKPTRVNKYNFPFRELVKCGECGCSIVADQKIQAICTGCKHKFSIKNKTECPKCGLDVGDMVEPTIVNKTYHRCSKRRGICSQVSLESEEFQKQIKEVLNTIAIPGDFHEWAKEVIEYMQKDEIGEQKTIQSKHQKRETELLSRLDNLVQMRADGEISSEQLRKQTEITKKELDEFRYENKRLHSRAVDWAEKMNECINFSKDAVDRFENGSPEVKTSILAYFGSNLVMIDKKLWITVPKPLLEIKKTYERIKDEPEWFEHENTIENKGSNGQTRRPIEVGLRGLDSNQ